MAEENDTYLTIEADSKGQYKEKGSRFLAYAFPVSSEDEVKQKLVQLRKEYHDARHHCYAYRIGLKELVYRINDDGEPSGTAGRPIYGVILSNNLTQILIVVVRYFGGIKLGVPGLIHAYRTAAEDAIGKAKIIEHTIMYSFTVKFSYLQMNSIMKVLKETNSSILSYESDEHCIIRFKVRKAVANSILNRFFMIGGVSVEMDPFPVKG